VRQGLSHRDFRDSTAVFRFNPDSSSAPSEHPPSGKKLGAFSFGIMQDLGALLD